MYATTDLVGCHTHTHTHSWRRAPLLCVWYLRIEGMRCVRSLLASLQALQCPFRRWRRSRGKCRSVTLLEIRMCCVCLYICVCVCVLCVYVCMVTLRERLCKPASRWPVSTGDRCRGKCRSGTLLEVRTCICACVCIVACVFVCCVCMSAWLHCVSASASQPRNGL
jgi:hypothetical protein